MYPHIFIVNVCMFTAILFQQSKKYHMNHFVVAMSGLVWIVILDVDTFIEEKDNYN